eukprot:6180055-Pleurochrysis_carterae.AAC.2
MAARGPKREGVSDRGAKASRLHAKVETRKEKTVSQNAQKIGNAFPAATSAGDFSMLLVLKPFCMLRKAQRSQR